MPGVPNWEGQEDSFVEEFLQADRDVNRPNEGDVCHWIEAGREESRHMGCPVGGERCEFRAEERGRGRGHNHVSEERQGLAVQDWAIVNPTGRGRDVSNAQGRGSRQEALFGKKVYTVVHIVVSMGLCPGEPELPRMGADGVEECLE